jgi:hypothetical protein
MNIPRDKKFFEVGEWAELLAEKDITEHPKEVLERFVREAVEDSYRREYYGALEFYDHEGPDWEDLTEEQRANIREINKQHAREMQEFGRKIAQGKT